MRCDFFLLFCPFSFPDKDIEKYRVDFRRPLGKGSYGTVYKGSQKIGGSPVAVKKIEIADNLNKNTLQEIQNLMSVKHTNIVQLLNVFEDDACWWIILEYCEQNLEEYLKSFNPDLSRKLTIMHECALGIGYLHNQKDPVCHRDIKLTNILLKSSTGGQVVKICDFGLSRKVQSIEEIMTSDCGTLAFMAPEFFSKVDGQVQYTASIDTFALGLVFKIILDYGCEGPYLHLKEGENNAFLIKTRTLLNTKICIK